MAYGFRLGEGPVGSGPPCRPGISYRETVRLGKGAKTIARSGAKRYAQHAWNGYRAECPDSFTSTFSWASSPA